MKEKLISFETAKLAKEKGFDIPVEYGGFNSKMRLTRKISMYKIHLTNWNKNHTISGKPSFSVPTQSLLQRWLRKNHKLNIEIGMQFEVWFFSVNKIPYDSFNASDIVGGTNFKSYEKALETGLQEALKLIK